MLRALTLALAVFVSCQAFAAEQAVPAEKLVPPGPLDEQAGIKAVHALLGDEIAKAKSATEKSVISAQLLTLAQDTKGNPLARWGAFRESIRLANEAANPAASFSAIESQAKYFAIDVPKQKLRALRESFEGPPEPPISVLPTLAMAALVAAREAELADDYDTAAATADLAHAVAIRGKDLATREAAEKTRATIKLVAKEFETASKAIAANPNDPEANLAWGRFLCLGRGDWVRGLPYLSKASGDMAALAKDDLSSPTDAAVQARLAGHWWDRSEMEKEERFIENLKRRSAWWYQKALPGLSGPGKATAEQRIAAASVTAAAGR